jgi:hypothetical protein
MQMSSGFAILRIPTCSSHVSPPGLASGPRDLYLVTVVKLLVGVSGFRVSQCKDFLSLRFPILRIPTRHYTDSWLPQWRFPPFRRTNSWPHGGTFLPVEIFPDGSDGCHLSTSPTPSWPHIISLACRDIAFRDFKLQDFLVLRISDTPISDSLRISDMHPK